MLLVWQAGARQSFVQQLHSRIEGMGLELTPVKSLNSPGSKVSCGIAADNSCTGSLLLLPGPDNQRRRSVIWGHNLAISELSSCISKEGVQRGLAVNWDNHEEVSRLVVPDVDIDG